MRYVDKAIEQLIVELIKLQQKENDLRTILKKLTVTNAFLFFDNKWKIVYLNHEADRMFIKPKEEVIDKCVWDLFPELIDSEVYLKYQEAMNKQIPVAFEVECIYTGKWFEVRAYPLDNGLSVFFNDITQRKHQEITFKNILKYYYNKALY